jgi:hypothetical protein
MEDNTMSEQLIPTPGVFGETGNFMLERELGQGGMGGVYLGRDKMLDRPVAVKVMLPEYGKDPEFVSKFKKEAQAVAKLLHPNIAQVYSYGICNEMPYIAMELVTGTNLEKMIEHNKGTTEVQRVIKIIQQIAQALQCASDMGIIHGDVKPENILLDANGNAKLVDFGLAAMQKDTNEIWGTPYYISPEKVKKEPVDFRADMYSLGGTLYHALTGVPPFDGDDAIAVVKARFQGAPKKPSEVRPGLTPAVDDLVMTMLALNKEDRFPSFEALIEQIKEVLRTGLGTTQRNPTVKMDASGQPVTATATGVKTIKTGGTKMIRPIRKRPGLKVPPKPGAATPGEGEAGSKESAGAEAAKAEAAKDDEEEEGGSVVGKILMFVGIGVAAIGGIIGFLVWYQVSDKAEREAALVKQINDGIAKARQAIAETRTTAAKFADDFDVFTKQAMDGVEKTTSEMKQIMPDYASYMQFEPTQELKDAIEAAKQPSGAVPAPEAPAAEAPAPAPEAAPAPATEAAPAAPATEAAPAAEGAAAPAAEMPPVINDLKDLWDRACSCQASAIRIRMGVEKVVKMCDEAEQISGNDRATMEKLSALSRKVVEDFDIVKNSKDVENVKKGIGYITSKGDKTVKQTVNRLRLDKLEADRKAKKEAEQADREARKKAAEEARAAKVEEETQAIRAKFDALVAQGVFRQLDWKSAERQLNQAKAECTTAEAEIATQEEMRKVVAMKSVQDIFIKNLKNYTFKRSKLKGSKVTGINDKEIVMVKSNGTPAKLTWTKFYQGYHGNLNELIIEFVEGGRENCNPRLAKRPWADAMCGAALTMRIICSDDPKSAERGEQIAQKVVQEFPDYEKYAKAMFPDIEFVAKPDEL